QFGYYEFTKDEIANGIDQLLARYREDPNSKVSAIDYRLEMAKIFARSIDEHIAPSLSNELTSRSLAIALVPLGNSTSGFKYIAFKPGSTNLYHNETPYLKSIAGEPVEVWLQLLGSIFPQVSPQLMARNFSLWGKFFDLLYYLKKGEFYPG